MAVDVPRTVVATPVDVHHVKRAILTLHREEVGVAFGQKGARRTTPLSFDQGLNLAKVDNVRESGGILVGAHLAERIVFTGVMFQHPTCGQGTPDDVTVEANIPLKIRVDPEAVTSLEENRAIVELTFDRYESELEGSSEKGEHGGFTAELLYQGVHLTHRQITSCKI